MTSLSDSPLEVIEQVIDALQDDLDTLKACSQTCRSLLPLCRKYLFQSIQLIPRSWSPPQLPQLPRHVVSFGCLLNGTPGIADHVRNLTYQTEDPYFEDGDVPRVLEKLHRVQYFRLIGVGMDWRTLRPAFQKSLTNLIQARSVTRLEISCVENFPIATLIPCVNLIDLKLRQLRGVAVESYELEHSMADIIPQLQSLTVDVSAGKYATNLVKARHSNDLPLMDFSHLRTLNVCVEEHSDLVVTQALLNATEKLETLEYIVYDLTDGFMGLAASINVSSFSTLRMLHFEFDINDDIQDPLCGLSEELGAFTVHNLIEVINIKVQVDADSQCKTGDEWRRLDDALVNGFPKLGQVSLHISIGAYTINSDGIVLQEKLSKLPEEQFLRLSKKTKFSFLVTIN